MPDPEYMSLGEFLASDQADRDLTAADPVCPVCECAIVDDLAHIDHCHLGEVAVHGVCVPADMMLDAIWSVRRDADDWRRRSREWHDRFAKMRTARSSLRARIAELEKVIEDQLTEIGDKGARITALKAAVAGLEQQLQGETLAGDDLEEQLDQMAAAKEAGGEAILSLRRQRDAARAELEQQAKIGEQYDRWMSVLGWRCPATTTRASFSLLSAEDYRDHRAVWCELPNGHVGHHHAQLDEVVSLDWPDPQPATVLDTVAEAVGEWPQQEVSSR
ncbi:hypothetical protein ACFRAQ_36045 [Nocardia sp. NPDC056611]|uniref:hypothetical protein n=1 Tax=Nocardia sp. NPDC056611 TaxID=3345877 RepID=UPI0036730F3E